MGKKPHMTELGASVLWRKYVKVAVVRTPTELVVLKHVGTSPKLMQLYTTWVVAENVPEELIDMIPEVIEVGNIDAEGASVDVHRPRKFTEENDMGIKYHSGSTSKIIGGMVTSDKTGKLTEVIKEAGEKEGFEEDTWELIKT
ncbi:hypothetical protein ACJX0J_026511 [Zea mays]